MQILDILVQIYYVHVLGIQYVHVHVLDIQYVHVHVLDIQYVHLHVIICTLSESWKILGAWRQTSVSSKVVLELSIVAQE